MGCMGDYFLCICFFRFNRVVVDMNDKQFEELKVLLVDIVTLNLMVLSTVIYDSTIDDEMIEKIEKNVTDIAERYSGKL